MDQNQTFPPQEQNVQPGIEANMIPKPIYNNPAYEGARKLWNQVAIITGGDSGIGRAVALAFAKEGANVVIPYLYESIDAEEARLAIQEVGRECLLLEGDLRQEVFSHEIVEKTLARFGKIDILVNNAAVQFPQTSILDITTQQLEDTFRTNIISYFHLTKAVLPHLVSGSTIINTASVTAYQGSKDLIDYSATKGAVVTFTRSLALSLVEQGIRVNAVAPGPIWTPLIPASFSAEKVMYFGSDTPMKRAGQPFEVAPAYVFLASRDSAYMTGQVIHVDGGRFITS